MRIVLATFLVLLIAGCATAPRIVLPERVSDPVTVAVADYGQHSSLLLPDAHRSVTEYVYGDWNWYAAGNTRSPDAFSALFASSGAALGRRTVAGDFDDPFLIDTLGATRLLLFNVERTDVAALKTRLEDRFARRVATSVYNADRGFLFVREDEPYRWNNNCNHINARWLKELGCEVEGNILYSDFQLAP